MKEQNRILSNENASREFAEEMAMQAKKGDIIFLYGELGAGKTYFTTHFCHKLGVDQYVSSPSYILMNEYSADEFSIYHLDLYRLGSAEEVLELGITDFMDDAITIIEWPNIAEEMLPENRLELYFEVVGNHRTVRIIDRRNNEFT